MLQLSLCLTNLPCPWTHLHGTCLHFQWIAITGLGRNEFYVNVYKSIDIVRSFPKKSQISASFRLPEIYTSEFKQDCLGGNVTK